MVITARRASWRQMRYYPTLEEAISTSRRLKETNRVVLHPDMDVSLPDAIDCCGPERESEKLAQVLRRFRYWAAPLEAVVIPQATFLPEQSVVFWPDYALCDELVYDLCHDRTPKLWQPNGKQRQISNWYATRIVDTPVEAGAHALLHPRWHNIYTHWFTEFMAALFDAELDAAGFDHICVPNGPRFQRESLEFTRPDLNKFKILDRPIHRFEIAVVPTHVFARTWLHPAIAPGLLNYAAHIVKNLQAGEALPKRPIYLSREDAKVRRMVNEAELAAALEEIGFQKVVATDLSFAEQVRTFANASALVSPHGSGLTNMLFLPEGAPVLELRAMYAGSRGMLWDRSYQILAGLTNHPYSAAVFKNLAGQQEWSIDIPYAVAAAKRLIGASS